MSATTFNENYNKIIDVFTKTGSKQPWKEITKRFHKRELDYSRFACFYHAFYRAKRSVSVARYCHDKLSVRLSVCNGGGL